MLTRLLCLALLLLPRLICAQTPDAESLRQQELAKQPPHERLLKGEDAKKAQTLGKLIEEHEASDAYPKAIKSAKELLELRVNV